MANTKYVFHVSAAGNNPVVSGDKRLTLRNIIRMFTAILSGQRMGGGNLSVRAEHTGVAASAIVTCAAVAGADTVTINGQALTATQHNATGTVTPTTSGIDIDDTVTINGYAFTAKATELLTSGHFKADGTDAQCCTSLAACINASTSPLIAGIVTATASATVVTIRAVTAGTGGNSITLASSDAQLAVSAATLANGATVANNQFDYVGSNTQTGDALAAALIASTTAIVGRHVTATNASGAVTISSLVAGHAGNAITIATSNGTRLAITGALSRLGGGSSTTTSTFAF